MLRRILQREGIAFEDEKRSRTLAARVAPESVPPDVTYQSWILYRHGRPRGRLEGTVDGWQFTRFKILGTGEKVAGPAASASTDDVAAFVRECFR